MPQFPFSLSRGGLEVQTAETVNALRALDVDAHVMSLDGGRFDSDVLHVFGPGGLALDVINKLAPPIPTVASCLFGTYRRATQWRIIAKRFASSMANTAGLTTDYAERRQLLNRVDRVVLLTDLEADYCAALYDIPRSRLVVVPNGVTEEFFEPDPTLFHQAFGKEDFVLFVGTIIPRKGPLLLAQAMEPSDMKVVFVGPPGPESSYVEDFERVVGRQANFI